jgi:hypothetical protein
MVGSKSEILRRCVFAIDRRAERDRVAGMKKKRSAAEKIADALGMDIADVRDGRYQPSKYPKPAVYVVGDDYYAVSDSAPRYCVGQPWERVSSWRGDDVWCSKIEETF